MEKEETLRENPLCSRVIQPPKLSLLSHYSEIIQLLASKSAAPTQFGSRRCEIGGFEWRFHARRLSLPARKTQAVRFGCVSACPLRTISNVNYLWNFNSCKNVALLRMAHTHTRENRSKTCFSRFLRLHAAVSILFLYALVFF
jgi:hypothetical protein